MNWDEIEENWKENKRKAKQKWRKLTANEVDVVAGRREELVRKLQERYSMARVEAERQVEEFRKSLRVQKNLGDLVFF
jgi:uncharacterized protein YjbJ (UPF0337 family)